MPPWHSGTMCTPSVGRLPGAVATSRREAKGEREYPLTAAMLWWKTSPMSDDRQKWLLAGNMVIAENGFAHRFRQGTIFEMVYQSPKSWVTQPCREGDNPGWLSQGGR